MGIFEVALACAAYRKNKYVGTTEQKWKEVFKAYVDFLMETGLSQILSISMIKFFMLLQ